MTILVASMIVMISSSFNFNYFKMFILLSISFLHLFIVIMKSHLPLLHHRRCHSFD